MTAAADGRIKVWDAMKGEELAARREHDGAIYGLAFTPDGTRLVSGSYDQTAVVWETASWRPVATLRYADPVYRVAFDPAGERLAVGVIDGKVRLLDAR